MAHTVMELRLSAIINTQVDYFDNTLDNEKDHLETCI